MEKLAGQGAGTLLPRPLPPAFFGKHRQALGLLAPLFSHLLKDVSIFLPRSLPVVTFHHPVSGECQRQAGWLGHSKGFN